MKNEHKKINNVFHNDDEIARRFDWKKTLAFLHLVKVVNDCNFNVQNRIQVKTRRVLRKIGGNSLAERYEQIKYRQIIDWVN